MYAPTRIPPTPLPAGWRPIPRRFRRRLQLIARSRSILNSRPPRGPGTSWYQRASRFTNTQLRIEQVLLSRYGAGAPTIDIDLEKHLYRAVSRHVLLSEMPKTEVPKTDECSRLSDDYLKLPPEVGCITWNFEDRAARTRCFDIREQ